MIMIWLTDKLLQKYIDKEIWLADRKARKRSAVAVVEPGGKCVLEDTATKNIH